MTRILYRDSWNGIALPCWWSLGSTDLFGPDNEQRRESYQRLFSCLHSIILPIKLSSFHFTHRLNITPFPFSLTSSPTPILAVIRISSVHFTSSGIARTLIPKFWERWNIICSVLCELSLDISSPLQKNMIQGHIDYNVLSRSYKNEIADR